MKKLTALLLGTALLAALLTACGGSADADQGTAGDGTASDNMAVDPETGDNADTAAPESGDAGDTGAEEEPAHVGAIADAILAVNEVPNARDYDDFAVEYDLGLTMDNVVQYAGCVTNDAPKDCALVFVVQAKDGTVDTVVSELEAAKEAMSSSLYAEYADATAKAADARIVSKGNVVAFVVAGVNGPDYSAIDEAINTAMPE